MTSVNIIKKYKNLYNNIRSETKKGKLVNLVDGELVTFDKNKWLRRY